MRVLITTGIYPPAIGGPATHIAQIVRELRSRGHEVSVVTLADGEAEPEPGLTRLARGGFVPWRMVRTAVTIARKARGRDLIYVQGLWIEAAAANLVLRKPMVRKIVGDWAWERSYGRRWVSDSFDQFQQRRHGGRTGLLKALRALLTRRADRVIVPSEYLKRCVQRWGVLEDQVEVIPNAIEPTERASAAAVREPFRVVAVGRLTRWKGFEQIIAALDTVAEAQLTIVGDGPERHRLEARANTSKARKRVRFAGRLTQAEVMAELAAASVFVLNSGYEGFPHVLLEAFTAGVPVVAADVGGISEIVQDGVNGLLVPQGDVPAIALALGRVFREPDLSSRLTRGGFQTLERYTQKRMVDRLEQTLSAACHESAAALVAH